MVGGGGGSSTKSTIIVSIETGSTVGIYDSTYTTLIKSASEKSAGEYWLTTLNNGTYYIKATKGSDVSTMPYTISEYGVYRISMAYRTIPDFSYLGGTYEVVQDDDTAITDVAHYNDTNWKIRFLTSGTLSFSNLYGARDGIDVFLVGGGGSGYDPGSNGNGGGGGGGYTTTALNKTVVTGTNYTITIGDGGAMKQSGGNAGGDTEAFSESASGGKSASNGGAGGSGGGNFQTGDGGSDGANGGNSGGTGQGTTTREFGETNAKLYSGGGGAGGNNGPRLGGDGGGGRGATDSPSYASTAGETNTGGGGGGGHAAKDASAGGSGIVIIRNARS